MDLPKNFDLQPAAFVHDLSVYDNEKEYYDSNTAERRLSAQTFIPTGLLSSEEERKNTKPTLSSSW